MKHGPTEDYRDEYLRLNAALDDATAALAATLRDHGSERGPPRRYRIPPPTGSSTTAPSRTRRRRPPPGSAGSARPPSSCRPSSARPCAWRPCSPTSTCPPASRSPRGAAATAPTCVDACPAGCGRDVAWRAGMRRDDLFDATACRHHMTQYTEHRAADLRHLHRRLPALAQGLTLAAGRPVRSPPTPLPPTDSRATLRSLENGFHFQEGAADTWRSTRTSSRTELAARGLRLTRQRRAVVDAVAASDACLSPLDVYQAARASLPGTRTHDRLPDARAARRDRRPAPHPRRGRLRASGPRRDGARALRRLRRRAAASRSSPSAT